MKTKKIKQTKQALNIHRTAKIVGLILLIPLIGSFTVEGGGWTFGDFLIAAVLLFGTGIALEYAAQNITHPLYRVFACCAILATLLVIWAELAVGIFY
jgi:hypothetical protein